MKKMTVFFLSLLSAAAVAAGAEPDAAEFLNALRRSVSGNRSLSTYAKLEGTVEHLRNDADAEVYPLFFAVMITPERSMSQVIIDDKEGYYVGQSVGAAGAGHSAITPMQKLEVKDSLLARVGVSPIDLAVGFVNYDLVRELEPETVGIAACRVLLLREPSGKEQVRVYASGKYLFVLKADFLDPDDPADAPARRSVEISAFRKSNDLHYVKKLNFSGPGWRSRVVFDDADVGTFEPDAPPKIFRSLRGQPEK